MPWALVSNGCLYQLLFVMTSGCIYSAPLSNDEGAVGGLPGVIK